MDRTCCNCKRTFPIEDFPKATNKSGHRYRCKECSQKRENELKSNNLRTYFGDLLKTSKRSAKTRKIDCYDLDVDFLLDLYNQQNGKCAITGIPMTHIAGQGIIPTNISMDRIDNSLGYTKDNVQLTCRFINHAKMNMSMEQFTDLLHQAFINMF